jgi:hypothetical protein
MDCEVKHDESSEVVEVAEMRKEYTVLDENSEASGSLEMVICRDYASFAKVMNFDWAPGGFQFFEKQLPSSDIYPVAVLEWLEINFKKRRRGIGLNAIRAFRVIAEKRGARLGWPRVGTGVLEDGEELDSALQLRKRLYERDSWIRFENPPIEGLVVFWMYHLLPLLQPAERALRSCLVEKPPKDPFFGLSIPAPI